MVGKFRDYGCQSMPPEDYEFLIGCCLGDGCIYVDRNKWNSTMICLSHTERHLSYLEYKASRLKKILGSKATIRKNLEKGKYYSYQYFAGNTAILYPIHQKLYPSNRKTLTPKILNQLGIQALALFWMDDGSLYLRRKPLKTRVGMRITDRQGCLAVYRDEEETKVVADWIYEITGTKAKFVRHVKGSYFLRWTAQELRNLVEQLHPYIYPIECMRYKIDLQHLTEASPNTNVG